MKRHIYEGNFDPTWYAERTDRNIGWITREEQQMLLSKTVGIAGCGGMGGLIAQILLRLGIGHIKIADCEVFDVSNINRQFGALQTTVGKSKAQETARLLRETADDTKLTVYEDGITEETVDDFLSQCDIVCDEIEFWAVGSRILLHQRARALGVSVFNCNTVGWRTHLFFFTPESGTMEACLGMEYEAARNLQEKIAERRATPDEIQIVMDAVIRGLIPILPEYSADTEKYSTVETAKRRLFEEGKATIIATNPPMASGFVANRVLMHLLADSPIPRTIVAPPAMPGYLLFDAALMETAIVCEAWWNDTREVSL